MRACWCTLGGTEACIGCPNNTGIINNHMTYVQEYTPTIIQYDPEESLKQFEKMIKTIEDGRD